MVDKTGVIRYVHPGGEFHEAGSRNDSAHAQCEREYRQIERTINSLLTE